MNVTKLTGAHCFITNQPLLFRKCSFLLIGSRSLQNRCYFVCVFKAIEGTLKASGRRVLSLRRARRRKGSCFALIPSRLSGIPLTSRACLCSSAIISIEKKLNKRTQLTLNLRTHFKLVRQVTGLGNSIQFCWRWERLRKQPSLLAPCR